MSKIRSPKLPFVFVNMAMSADGTHVLGASEDDLYVSQDSGTTWVETPTGAPSGLFYRSAAVSAKSAGMLTTLSSLSSCTSEARGPT